MNKHKYNKNEEKKEFGDAVIQIDRVTRVVKGGRRLRFRATVCVGNQKGKVGIGIGKSNEVVGAIQKATHKAKKNLIKVPMTKGTIPHDTKVKYKSSSILIMPASEGTGLIAGGTVRKVLELAGVKNILSKAYGSNNRVNIAKAAVEALRSLRVTPKMAEASAKRIAARQQSVSIKAEPKKEPVKAKATSAPAAAKPKN